MTWHFHTITVPLAAMTAQPIIWIVVATVFCLILVSWCHFIGPRLLARKALFADNAASFARWLRLCPGLMRVRYRELYNNSVLHMAVQSCHKDVVQLLLDKKMNINIRNSIEATPLHSADAEIAELLLERGADPNAQDVDGQTCLHYVVGIQGGLRMTELLLRHGADPDIRDSKGNTAFELVLDHIEPPEDLPSDPTRQEVDTFLWRVLDLKVAQLLERHTKSASETKPARRKNYEAEKKCAMDGFSKIRKCGGQSEFSVFLSAPIGYVNSHKSAVDRVLNQIGLDIGLFEIANRDGGGQEWYAIYKGDPAARELGSKWADKDHKAIERKANQLAQQEKTHVEIQIGESPVYDLGVWEKWL